MRAFGLLSLATVVMIIIKLAGVAISWQYVFVPFLIIPGLLLTALASGVFAVVAFVAAVAILSL